eukprot:evm.model.NODE_346_length_1066_cov_54.308632.1
MGDVLRRLGNRTLTVWGDSVASQHAHGKEEGGGGHVFVKARSSPFLSLPPSLTPSLPAMECSWLRSGKAKTLAYEKQDYNRIFRKKEDGGGFNRAGGYGTNALYSWHTQLVTQAEGGGLAPGHAQQGQEMTTTKEGDGDEGGREEGGVEGTMKLYLTYRPLLNESGPMIEEADVLVVNFGLHYLIDKRQDFQEEMRALLNRLRDFGQTEGKQLVWRE